MTNLLACGRLIHTMPTRHCLRRLRTFIDGLRVLENLRPEDRVLICEACNHDRIQDDIGTVQIPRALRARFGPGVRLEWSFGRECVRAWGSEMRCDACVRAYGSAWALVCER